MPHRKCINSRIKLHKMTFLLHFASKRSFFFFNILSSICKKNFIMILIDTNLGLIVQFTNQHSIRTRLPLSWPISLVSDLPSQLLQCWCSFYSTPWNMIFQTNLPEYQWVDWEILPSSSSSCSSVLRDQRTVRDPRLEVFLFFIFTMILFFLFTIGACVFVCVCLVLFCFYFNLFSSLTPPCFFCRLAIFWWEEGALLKRFVSYVAFLFLTFNEKGSWNERDLNERGGRPSGTMHTCCLLKMNGMWS